MNFKFFISIFTTTKVQYITALSNEEVIRKLEEIVAPETRFPFFNITPWPKPYVGEILENRFEFTPGVLGKGSMIPIVSGTFNFKDDENIIDVKLKMSFIQSTGIGFPLVFMGIFSIWMILEEISGGKFYPLVLIPLAISIGGIVLLNLFCNSNVSICIKDLSKIFEVEAIEM